MAEVEPQQPDGALARNGQGGQKSLDLLAHDELWRPPMDPGIFRARHQDRGEVRVVFEPGDIHRVTGRGGANVLAGEAKLATGAGVDGVRVGETGGINGRL